MGQIRIGEYLFRRIKELGVKSIFGVPGDYELALLDLVPKCGLDFKNNANELVAGYAADGYARVNGIGCLVTTFGPGELSAANAIGGSYAECLPIIHVVGYPAMPAINGKMIIHHTPGRGDYESFHQMSKYITCSSTVLLDATKATSEIDRVLNDMVLHSKPCYIGVPGDIGQAFIEEPSNLAPLSVELPPPEGSAVQQALEEIAEKLGPARKPLVIVDAGTQRANQVTEVMAFIERYNLAFVETSMSKGALDEKHPLFAGHYPGIGTSAETRQLVIDSDCILWFGPFRNDLNTPTAALDIKDKVLLDFHRTHLDIDATTHNVSMKAVLSALSTSAANPLFKAAGAPQIPKTIFPEITPPAGDVIKSDWLFSYLSNFFQSGDVLVTETGTTGVNIRRTYLPHGVAHLTQKLWGSIGFATGAALGGFVAAKEIGAPTYKRNILITGDGSFQMTAQAFGDYMRYYTNGYIFVINNDGYAVERAIHGATAPYNDIAPWNYQLLPAFFDVNNSQPTAAFQIRTPQEFHDLINDQKFLIPDRVRVIEIFTGKFDYGAVLDALGPKGDRFNLGLDPNSDIETDPTRVRAGIGPTVSNGLVQGAEHHIGG